MPATFLNDDQAVKITLHNSVPFHYKNRTRKLTKTLTHLTLKAAHKPSYPLLAAKLALDPPSTSSQKL